MGRTFRDLVTKSFNRTRDHAQGIVTSRTMSGVGDGARELLISTGAAADDVLVAVRDTGPGLPPSSAEHLFDAFYTTKADGVGMGLSICRSIIEAHGGRLWASANLPRGAVFQFTAPAYAGEQST